MTGKCGYMSRIKLRDAFDRVMIHLEHDEDQREAAWLAAMAHPYRAWACYSAILRSL